VDLVRDRWAGKADRVRRELPAVESGVSRGGVRGVLFRDDHVEVARPGLREGRLRFVLHHLDPHLRVVATHRAEGRRHEGERRRLEHGYADGARHRRGRCAEVGLCAFEGVEEGVGVSDEDLRLRCELHAATDLAEQFDARLLFQHRQLLRHRGRAEVEGRGDFGDGAPDPQFAEEPEAADVQHGGLQSIGSADVYRSKTFAVSYASCH
jgi:hypothetical protein